ncbi:universal stress protein [uncultured Pontibacter sp.]|uniref:universal stress protein n=1 Tax=uncultured Pontibacter sp. TaxID=453356 RepID=UPI00260397B7|nr:universal stress protein [uncultured Pontibacter sp.]
MLRILAPTDFSTDGYNATLVAMQLAKALRAEVVFVHAMAKPPVPAASPESIFRSVYSEEMRKTQVRLLDEAQHLLDILDLRHAEVRYKTLVVPTPFADAMLQVIASENIDLVVIGSRGSSQLKQILIGSNTLELMRLSPVPLLVIPSYDVFNGFENITILLEQMKLPERAGIEMLDSIAQTYNAILHFLILTKDGQQVQDVSELQEQHSSWLQVLKRPHTTNLMADSEAPTGMRAHIAATNSSLVVLMPEKLSIWEALFSKNLSEELAARAHMPLLILPHKV